MTKHLRCPAFTAVVSAIALGCGGGSSGTDGRLPWEGSFIPAEPSQAEVIEIAENLRDEMQSLVPAATRADIAAHVISVVGPTGRIRSAGPSTVTLDPRTAAEAYVMAGVGAAFMGSLSGAAWAFSQAVLADPQDPYALNQAGWALLELDEEDDARLMLLRALYYEPNLWAALASLSRIYENEGDDLRAIHFLEGTLEQHPESLFNHLRLAGLKLRNGNIEGARVHVEQALAVAPDDPEALSMSAEVAAAEAGFPELPASASGGGSSRKAFLEVLREVDACMTEQTAWLMTAATPIVTEGYIAGMNHEDDKSALQHRLTLCLNDCGGDDACAGVCYLSFCSDTAGRITSHYMVRVGHASRLVGLNTAHRARYRSCAYAAIEDRARDLSGDDLGALLESVDFTVRALETADIGVVEDEHSDYLVELDSISSVCSAPYIREALAEIDPNARPPLFDLGVQACADGFFCLTFGETSIGFSVGVGLASGGLSLDYGVTDLIFSIGVGPDLGVFQAGVSAKLSIRRGIGLSPSVGFGGPIRATASRDYWLFNV